jgi:hypothetical protein
LALRLTCQGHLFSGASCPPTMPTRSRTGAGAGQGTASEPRYSPTLAQLFPEPERPSLGYAEPLACGLWGRPEAGLTRGHVDPAGQEEQCQRQQFQHLKGARREQCEPGWRRGGTGLSRVGLQNGSWGPTGSRLGVGLEVSRSEAWPLCSRVTHRCSVSD